MKTYQLTEQEAKEIDAIRAKAEQREEAKIRAVAELMIAAKFARWLLENRREASYSTFYDEFGYQESDARFVYSAVAEIIRFAREGES